MKWIISSSNCGFFQLKALKSAATHVQDNISAMKVTFHCSYAWIFKFQSRKTNAVFHSSRVTKNTSLDLKCSTSDYRNITKRSSRFLQIFQCWDTKIFNSLPMSLNFCPSLYYLMLLIDLFLNQSSVAFSPTVVRAFHWLFIGWLHMSQ